MSSLKSNQEIYDWSADNLEVIGDPFYKNERVIISDTPDIPNDLMLRNQKLIEQITAYKVAIEHGDESTQGRIIGTVLGLLLIPEINVSEFVTFWATLDVSFSVFQELPVPDKRTFIKVAIESYITSRYELYGRHGYSATTLQVRQDSFAHKGSGNNGLNKLKSLFSEKGFRKATSLEDFLATDLIYIFPDDVDSGIFDALIAKLTLRFNWSQIHQGKRPDAAFRFRGELFLLEHKHKKEEGGGQNGQLGEIISFIQSEESESFVHHVSFLDGLYFNQLVTVTSTRNKIYRQLVQIKTALADHPLNYFVNTEGFRFLLS
ncbi:MAG: hypothetical protein WA058_03915 [Minisyncoccia bacterium]